MKQYVLKTLIYLIPIVLLDGLFFIFLDYKTAPDARMAGLISINVGYAVILLAPLAAPRGKGQKVLAGSLFLTASFYIVPTLLVGVAFIIWPPSSILWPVVIQSCLLAIFLIYFLGSILANDATTAALNAQRSQGKTIRDRAAEVRSLEDIISNPECKRLIHQCYVELSNAPLVSSEETAATEQEIDSLIQLLHAYVIEDITDEIIKTSKQLRLANNRRSQQLKHLINY